MTAAGAALAITCLLASGDPPPYVESRILVEGELLSYECPDLDDDRRGDVLLATLEHGERVLRVHRQLSDGRIDPEPWWRLSVPRDVVAYALADVRDDPGREVLLFTGGGFFSISPRRAGLRGNLRREWMGVGFPDLSAADELPRWGWVRDLDGDGEVEVGVVSAGRFLVLGRRRGAGQGRGGAAEGFAERGGVPLPRVLDERGDGALALGRVSLRSGVQETRFFPGETLLERAFDVESLLALAEGFAAPNLVDWDRDGRIDAVVVHEGRLWVHLQREDGGFRSGRKVELPGAFGEPDDVEVRLVDLDADGGVEAVRVASEREGVDQVTAVTVYRVGRDGVPEEKPVSRTKLGAAAVSIDLVDVDDDGVLDLVARTFDLPSAVEQLTRLSVETEVLVFRGRSGLGFAPRPEARFARRFRPKDLARFRETLISDLSGDFDGDGLSDLVILRPDGVMQILPLRRRSGRLSFSDEPLATVTPARPVRDARPAFLSHDRYFDLVLRHEDGVTVFVSTPGGEGGR